MPEGTETIPAGTTTETTPPPSETPALTPEQIEFQGNMALAFDDQSLIPKVEEKADVPHETLPLGDQPSPPPTTPPVTPSVPTSETDEEIIDANTYLKEQLGYDDWETAKAEIEKLRAKQDLEFTDDQSKKIHELLRQGKIKEVVQFYQAQELLADSDSMNNEQKLKLYIKMQNPKFDNELIEDEYNALYVLDETDEKLLDATSNEVDPLKLRKERLRLEQRVDNDVAKAQEYFSQYKAKIQLPDTQPPAPATVNEDFEAYKASNAKADETYNNVTVPGINALKESDVQLGFKVDDANNQMQFEVAIVPTKEDFDRAKQDSLSLTQFLAKTCYDKDGKFLPAQLQRMVLLTQNFDNYAQSIARQAVNEERRRVIAKETPNGNGGKDFNVNPEKTELQKRMEFALS